MEISALATAFPHSGHISIAFNIPTSSCADKLGRGFMRFSFRICFGSRCTRFMNLRASSTKYIFYCISFQDNSRQLDGFSGVSVFKAIALFVDVNFISNLHICFACNM